MDDERLRYLGSADSYSPMPSAPTQRGAISFLDAYPLEWPRLEVDVLTPHYKQYYDAASRDPTGNQGPFDWDEPVPIPFLTVASGTQFAVRLVSHHGLEAERTRAFAWAWKHLQTGLEVLGLGAKTAVGYGLMSVHRPPVTDA